MRNIISKRLERFIVNTQWNIDIPAWAGHRITDAYDARQSCYEADCEFTVYPMEWINAEYDRVLIRRPDLRWSVTGQDY